MMRKTAIFKLAVWSIVAVVLIGVLVSGSYYRGRPLLSFNWNGEHGNNQSFEFNMDVDRVDDFVRSVTKGADEVMRTLDGDLVMDAQYQLAAEDVEALSVVLRNGNVTIIPEQRDDITVTEWYRGNADVHKPIEIRMEGDTLSVRQPKYITYLGFLSFGTPMIEVEIRLPQKLYRDVQLQSTSGRITVGAMSAGDVRTEATSGSIELNGLQADTLYADVTSGQITGSSLSLGRFEAETTSGTIDVEGALEEMVFDVTSGSVKAETSVLPRVLEAEMTSGNVTVTLPDNEGFGIRYDLGSGKLDSDFALTTSLGDSRKSGVANYGKNGPMYSMDVTSGHARIRKGT